MTYQDALAKAAKLLKLAQDKRGNENETAQAAAMAQKIIDEHKLDINDLNFDQQQKEEDNEPVVDFRDDPMDLDARNFHFRWLMNLASGIARLNQCRVLQRRGSLYSSILILGRPSDVATVRYLYAWLKQEVFRLDKTQIGHSYTYRRSYCLGVVDTINQRLAAMQKATFAEKQVEQANNPLALVRVNTALARIEKRSQDVENFMKAAQKLPKGAPGAIGKGRASAEERNYTGGRYAGQRDGHKVRITSAKAGLGSGAKQLN